MNNIKKIIAVLLCAALLLTVAACKKETEDNRNDAAETLAQEQDDVFEQLESIAENNSDADVGAYQIPGEADFTWEAAEGGVALTGYSGTHKAVEIPAQLGGENVVEIRANAFADGSVTGVILPDTVVTVGDNAFLYCTTLVEIQFGAGVKTIGTDAFDGCVALTTVKLNEGLETIGQRAFAMCSSLAQVKIPETVVTIQSGAFVMSGLSAITIPGSVEEIGQQAFSSCGSLESVVICSGVKVIGECAFEDCGSLTSIEIPASVETLEYGVLLYSDNATIYAPAGSAAETYAGDNGLSFKAN